MKYKKSTNEFMEMFDDAKSSLEEAKKNVDSMSSAIDRQLDIIHSSIMYISKKISNMEENSHVDKDKIVLTEADIVGGMYSTYGCNLTPHLLRTPINLTNYNNDTNYIYKKNAVVTINDEKNSEAENIIIHDSIKNKELFFESYSSDILSIDIKLNNSGMLSSIRMNTIEISPILEGSFDILKIDVFSPSDDDNPVHTIENLNDVGNTRYILDSKTKISRVHFDIKLKCKDESIDKYIFGLRHIYLLDCDYSDGSYAVIKIHKDEDIKYVYNTVRLKSQNSKYNDSVLETKSLGIKYYMEYKDGSLSREITQSTETDTSYISINTNTIYMYLPIYTSYTSITPNIELHTD